MTDSGRFNFVQLVFGFNPSKAAAIVSGVAFLVITIALFVPLIRRRNWWGLILPIGTLCYALGFLLRYALVLNPFSLGILIATQLLIVVSPAAFLAFNYIVYGRLVRTFAGPGYSLIRPQIVARFFVISDFITFNLQSLGGSLETQKNQSLSNLGRVILLIGIIAQLGSYIFFIFVIFHSHRRIAGDVNFTKQNFPFQLFQLLYFSSVGNIIRGIYRTIELAQGQKGFLNTHEIYLYIFDTLPLLFATAIYAPFWPGKYIDEYSSRRENGHAMEALSH